jgi:hypothetical protein
MEVVMAVVTAAAGVVSAAAAMVMAVVTAAAGVVSAAAAMVMAVVTAAAKDMFPQPTASNPTDNLSDSNGGGGCYLAAAAVVTVVVGTPVGMGTPVVNPVVTAVVTVTVTLVMVTVTLHLQVPSHIGGTLDLGASVPATLRTAPPVQSRCRPTHQGRLYPT